MNTYTFDADNTLNGGLYGYSPRESVKLGIELCRAVEEAVGPEGCHGGIWPGNISSADGNVAIGEPYTGSISEMGPDAVEFVSPEQFWSGENSPAADVYSIGMILYTALNGGSMPFFDEGAEHTPEQRARALQSRMKGKDLEYPKIACRELGDVVLKATEFRREDRYKNPGELARALEELPESASALTAVPVVRYADAAVHNVISYKVDKEFEPIVPDKPKRQKKAKRQPEGVRDDMDVGEFRGNGSKRAVPRFIAFIAIIIVIAAAVLILRGCGNDEVIIPDPTPSTRISDPVVIDPKPTPTASPEPTPTPTAEPTVMPIEEKYSLTLSDVTWTEARALCEQAGGHLATVADEEELKNVIALAVDKGARFVWLGSYRDSEGVWRNVTGEEMGFALWDVNEPSLVDSDGTHEDYLLLWFRPATAEWTFNDMRDDPVSVLPRTFSGKIAYICEFE